MNIRPKILKYQNGGFTNYNDWRKTDYYNWFNNLYDVSARKLGGSPMTRDLSYWKIGGPTHHQTDDLAARSYSNYAYTLSSNKNNVTSDILNVANLKGTGLTPEQFRDLYNEGIRKMHSFQNSPHNYTGTNDNSTSEFNTLYNIYYKSKGTDNTQGGILFNEGKKGIYGTQTLQRDVDMYQKSFDDLFDDDKWDRIHKIVLNGKPVYYAKLDSGEIQLLPNINEENKDSFNNPSETPEKDSSETGGKIPPGAKDDPESLWSKLGAGLKNVAPDLLEAVRLAGTLHNNNRIFEESKKAIIPNLQQTYNTHRQVVGDEATKQAYYRRAALGETRAAQPFTSDADRLVAYMNEAKRIGDELRAQGDLADNLEIRRTSDESNQHQWANIARNTEVANSNLTELIKARAAKHQLNAQKYLADWTNIDLFLLGRQAKLERSKAKQEAIQDLIDLLTMLDGIYEDPEYRTAYENLQNVIKKHTNSSNEIDYNNPEVLEAQRKLRKAQNNYKIKYWKTVKGKQGTKLTYSDNTDKYLYRTSKDIVEHFRKMSKMVDDSRIRTMPKPIKLTSHPKKRKYLMGGVAPFYVYRPFMAGESTYQQSSGAEGSKSSKDTSAKDKLDMIKEMFKAVQNTGLPVDVNVVYRDLNNLFLKALLFGEEMSTDDIASIYLQSMLKISNLKYSKENYDKALAVATLNDALNEYAVDAYGNYVVQDKDANLTFAKSLSEIKEKGLNPITNQQLLNLRAYSPNMSFQKGDSIITNIINNGMGINKIGAQIKALADNLGSTEGKLEGISQVESGKVIAGLQILSKTDGTPDGYYSVTNHNKNLQELVKAALSYIENMLSPSLKAILNAHGGVKENIYLFLSSLKNYLEEQTISPLTGKASDKEADGDKNMLPSVAFFNGLGEKDSFIILDKTNDGLKIDVVSTPITSKGYNTGSITFNKLESSDFGGQLLMNLATMGDSLISSTGRNNIIIDGRIYQAELPIDLEAKRTTGIIKPDLRFLKKIEAADAKLRQMGIDKSDPKNIATVNKVYQENNLPILYTISNNKPTITSEYARFAIVNGVGTEDAFGDSPEFNDAILEISSDKERQLFETMMQQLGNSKYKLDNGYGIGPISWGETKLYKGTIYIPMVTSNISALAGTGFRAKGEEYNLIEARQQAANAAREMGFNPAGDASNLL